VGNSAVTATGVPRSISDPKPNSVSSVTGESNLNRRSGIMTVEPSTSPSSAPSGPTHSDPASEFLEEKGLNHFKVPRRVRVNDLLLHLWMSPSLLLHQVFELL